MADKWKATHLPPGYPDQDEDAINSVTSLIRELLKYEKSAFAKLVSNGWYVLSSNLLTFGILGYDWSKAGLSGRFPVNSNTH